MWEKVIEIAATNGIWALLFCALLVFELKDSRSREKKYQTTISDLNKNLGYMQAIDCDINEIRDEMRECLQAGEKELARGKV